VLKRCLRTAALAVALVALGGAKANADTISVTVGPDPTEEVPFPVSVSWTSGSTDQYVFVTIKPAGSLACAASYAADEPASDDLISRWTDSVAGTRSGIANEDAPGTYILCAYLQSGPSASAPAAATGPVPVTLRSARADVRLTVTPHADARQRVSVSASVTSELPRSLFVTVRPAGGRQCEAQHTHTSSHLLIRKQGEGAWTATEDFTAPDDGSYLLCAYIQEGLSDEPEATASATFVVGTDPCRAARTALAAARRSLRRAESAVARYRKQARRHSRRYRRAVRVRAVERRKLARARAAVTQVC
jgi:hypothetical protein